MNGHSPAPSVSTTAGRQLQRLIVVRTPENIELRYVLAGPGSRAAAYFIDLALMFFVGQVLLQLVTYLIGLVIALFQIQSELWAGALGALLGFLLYNGYFIFFEWLLNGQTPGKRLIHIRVIKQGGYALRFFDTLLRNLLRAIDFIPLFYGVGLVSILLTRDNQRLGDLVAGTLVVYQEPAQPQSLLLEDLDIPAWEPTLPAAQVAAVPSEVVSLAADFLRGRAELAPRPRQEIAAELLDLIRRASGLEPHATESTESFLISLVRQAEQALPWSAQTPAQA